MRLMRDVSKRHILRAPPDVSLAHVVIAFERDCWAWFLTRGSGQSERLQAGLAAELYAEGQTEE